MGLNIGFSKSEHDNKSVSFFSKYGRSITVQNGKNIS